MLKKLKIAAGSLAMCLAGLDRRTDISRAILAYVMLNSTEDCLGGNDRATMDLCVNESADVVECLTADNEDADAEWVDPACLHFGVVSFVGATCAAAVFWIFVSCLIIALP